MKSIPALIEHHNKNPDTEKRNGVTDGVTDAALEGEQPVTAVAGDGAFAAADESTKGTGREQG